MALLYFIQEFAKIMVSRMQTPKHIENTREFVQALVAFIVTSICLFSGVDGIPAYICWTFFIVSIFSGSLALYRIAIGQPSPKQPRSRKKDKPEHESAVAL
jgi:hypothetical protein